MSTDEIQGEFWLADAKGPRRSGLLRLEPGSAPHLTLRGSLTPMTRSELVSGTGHTAVYRHVPTNDFSVHTVHGLTAEGAPISLLEAQNHGYHGGLLPDHQTQVFRGVQAVIGAHLTGRDHEFSGVRVRLQFAGEMLLPAGDPSWFAPTPLQGRGAVHLEEGSDGIWLVLQGIDPLSIRGLGRRFLRPLATLLSLSVGQPVGVLALQVQHHVEGSWWPVHSGAHQASDPPTTTMTLLRATDLTPAVIATWLDQVDALGPLPPVVAAAMRGPVNLERMILELTTVSEGLHRRLCPTTVRFPKDAAMAVRKAAKNAAEAALPGAGKAVDGFLSHIHEVGYGKRLEELAAMAGPAIPGVTGRSNRWKAIVYAARNDFAHRATNSWSDDATYDKYITVALSLRWLLRAVLLQQAGIPSDVLAQRFLNCQEYQLFLEQARTWQPRIYDQHELP